MGVTATASALEAIARVQAARGPVAFFQSGGCCDGSSPGPAEGFSLGLADQHFVTKDSR